MIFRSRTHGAGRKADSGAASGPEAREDGRTAEQLLDEVGVLSSRNRASREPETERLILHLRHVAGLRLTEGGAAWPAYPRPAFDCLPDSNLPDFTLGELTPELLRAALLRDGCVIIRGLIDPKESPRFAGEIERAYEVRDGDGTAPGGEGYFEPFEPDPRFDLAMERAVIGGGAGLWAADSPAVMFEVFDVFERVGLQRLIAGYLGEHPAISVNKCLLRKVSPDLFEDATSRTGAKPSAWHQDGAFLGDVRALNVWLSLSRCGDEAPGLEIVPRRIEHIVATGTEGAVFDWSVSRASAEQAAGDVGIVRPIFEPGDALLFDELFLHSTAAEPDMPSVRYAVESWFFGPSAFPPQYVPLAF